MSDLTKDDIRKMGLHNFHFEWLDKNLGSIWTDLVGSLPNEKQWDAWDQLVNSKIGKAWDASLKKDSK